eukprot:TRINITY_DN18293_c0_g1_i1.p1 TRINITY_DN18293_c0_g1~~TRINITY_DN18293_c0_g1_i1.p1  ORF type:complete len:403 (-),score=98.31 TRINITY_DN18293_c0_g1_i1:84-1217(-)
MAPSATLSSSASSSSSTSSSSTTSAASSSNERNRKERKGGEQTSSRGHRDARHKSGAERGRGHDGSTKNANGLKDRRVYANDLEKQLAEFLAGDGTAMLLCKLDPSQRRRVHEWAEERGMTHESLGEGRLRDMNLAKKEKRNKEGGGGSRDVAEQAEHGDRAGEEARDEESAEEEEPEKSRKDDEAEEDEDENEEVAEEVAETSENGDREEGTEGGHVGADASRPPGAVASARKAKKKKAKKAKKDLPAGHSVEDALKELKIKPGTCPQCKERVGASGFVCKFCKEKYCIRHGLPEVHGCGKAAKKDARETWLRTSKVANDGAALQHNRKIDRDVLQGQLKKKIGQAGSGRQKSASSSGSSTSSARGRGRGRGRKKK